MSSPPARRHRVYRDHIGVTLHLPAHHLNRLARTLRAYAVGKAQPRWHDPIFRAQLLVTVFLLVLPYLLFHGRLFVGGDDSRLFYSYPGEFVRAIGWSSWFHFSSAGSENPNVFLLPLLAVLAALRFALGSPVIVSYLAFSAPFILGFFAFGRLASEMINRPENYRWEILLGSLLYILSPIMLVNQWSVFLYAVWLVAVLPLSLYYFTRFLRTGLWRYSLVHAAWLAVLSLAIFSVPWLLGALLPLSIGLTLGLIRAGRDAALRFGTRVAAFYGFAFGVQAFWIVPFFASLFSSSTSAAGEALSTDIGRTFAETVNATSRGSVVYPLLNLFHRQLAFDFSWTLRDVYVAFYDKVWLLNLVFLGVIIAGILRVRALRGVERHLFMPAVLALVTALLLFTVNVGPFKQVFLWLGAIPGFAMFRNFHDKFALGYIFLYAAVFTVCLVALSRRLTKHLRSVLLAAIGGLIILNALPMKQLIAKPLWMTDNPTTLSLPAEYLEFMSQLTETVPDTANVLSVPLGRTTYSIVKEQGSERVYAGRSPVLIFSGANDFAGTGSFTSDIRPVVEEMIEAGDYYGLRNLLLSHNIQYVLETRNIPDPVRSSYLFDPDHLRHQQAAFRQALFGSRLAVSRNGNYVLYRLKHADSQRLITTPSRLYSPPEAFAKPEDASALFALVSQRAVLLNRPAPQEHSARLQTVIPSRPVIVDNGVYRLGDVSATIRYDESTRAIALELKPGYELNAEPSEIEHSFVATVSQPDTVVAVGDELYRPSQLDGLEVGARDTIRLYRPAGGNLLGPLYELYDSWSRLDCGAYDRREATGYDITVHPEVTVTLTAKANHNACVYHDVKVNPDGLYRLSVAYRPDAATLDLQVYGGDNEQLLSETLPTAKADWQLASHLFTTNGNRTIRPHFYSGEAEGEARTSYRNIRLQRYRLYETIDIAAQLRRSRADEISVTAKPPVAFVLKPRTQTVSGRRRDLRRWRRGECYAVDARPKVSFEELSGTNGMELKGRGGHSACIHQNFPVRPRSRYTIQFEYYTEGDQRVTLFVGYGDQAKPTEVTLPVRRGEWWPFSYDLVVPRRAHLSQVYLQSGSYPRATALARYRKFRLRSVTTRTNFLTRAAPQPVVPPAAVDVAKLNQTTYRATFRGVRKDFLAQFSETYHAGWKAYPASANHWYETLLARPLPLAHYQANYYSNAWWIDVAETCSRSGTCQRNSDGTYDLTLVLHFTPQRYVYLGVLISILFAGAGVLSWWRYWRRHRRKGR